MLPGRSQKDSQQVAASVRNGDNVRYRHVLFAAAWAVPSPGRSSHVHRGSSLDVGVRAMG